MRKLLEFLIKKILGNEEFKIEETKDIGESRNGIHFMIKTDPKYIGLLIGKKGKTIKNIRNLIKVRAIIEGKMVNLSVEQM